MCVGGGKERGGGDRELHRSIRLPALPSSASHKAKANAIANANATNSLNGPTF